MSAGSLEMYATQAEASKIQKPRVQDAILSR
jgi:hypothetical protein